MSAECAEAPLVADIVLLGILIIDEILILLIDRVVRQVHVLVVLINPCGVHFRGETGQTLLENVDFQWLIGGYQDVSSEVEFMPVDE